MDIFVSF